MFLTSVPNLEIKRNIKKQQEKEPGVPVRHLQSAMSRAPPGAERNIQLSGCPASLLLHLKIVCSFPSWYYMLLIGILVNQQVAM